MLFSRLLALGRAQGVRATALGLPLFVAVPVMTETSVLNLVLTIVLLVLCVSAHEAAHAWVAWKCGDPTGKDLGRITLNPLPHIDPLLSVILPALLFMTTGHAFGGAKPVPVNFHRLRQPLRDMSFVAAAGPITNFLLAVLFLITWRFFVKTGYYNGAADFEALRRYDLLPSVLLNAVGFNVLLTVFNLIPIPPLDGSRIMAWVLPAPLRPHYAMVERFGIFIVFALLLWSPGFNQFLWSTVQDLTDVLRRVVTLGGRW